MQTSKQNNMNNIENSSAEKLNLEEIVFLANKIGLEYADAKRDMDYLELMKATIKARISIRLDNDSLSETKLRRLTETDPEYVKFLEDLSEAKSRCEKLRIRYDSYKNLFEAKRSMLSYMKAEMKLI
ncbi:MAG: hypothetical protein KBD78_11740 [Oligoflexales bacterium]|nr:hypothetical protein [Oligoflexales bacterium]